MEAKRLLRERNPGEDRRGWAVPKADHTHSTAVDRAVAPMCETPIRAPEVGHATSDTMWRSRRGDSRSLEGLAGTDHPDAGGQVTALQEIHRDQQACRMACPLRSPCGRIIAAMLLRPN